MSADRAREAVHALVSEVISIHQALPIERLTGVPFFDTQKDALFTSLRTFDSAAQLLPTLPRFAERCGSGEAQRTLLQFIYGYFSRLTNVSLDEAAFEELWNELIAEVETPFWVYRGVANLRHFHTEPAVSLIDLDDGISIRGRSRNDLLSLGVDDSMWEAIAADWRTPFGASSYVIVVDYRVLKEPENLVLMESGALTVRASRAIQALRLCAGGAIGLGPMWAIRAARFDFGLGGLYQSGFSMPTLGANFIWKEDIRQDYSTTYSDLAQLEKDGFGNAPGNLDVALRAFQSTYDRWPTRQDSQLLDAVTSLEALFGIETELSFRLAFRVAGLIAKDDRERSALLKLMRGFYDTRSMVVHGGPLKTKHQEHLRNIEILRGLVRTLLRSFVSFATRPPRDYPKRFFREDLDAALVDATERENLRAALGLQGAEGIPESSPQGTSSISSLEP